MLYFELFDKSVKYRAKIFAKLYDKLFILFKFEKNFFVKHGLETHWNEKGVKVIKAEYATDHHCLYSKRWHDNTMLAEEIKYLDDRGRMNVKRWDRKGELLVEGVFLEDGVTYIYREKKEESESILEKKGMWDGKGIKWEEVTT